MVATILVTSNCGGGIGAVVAGGTDVDGCGSGGTIRASSCESMPFGTSACLWLPFFGFLDPEEDLWPLSSLDLCCDFLLD